jgi:hypothetical protein
LANSFSGYTEFLANFLQCPTSSILKTKSELEYPPLAGSKAGQHIINLLLEQLFGGSINGGQSIAVFYEVA